jgi:hypothetical protein
MTYVQVTEEQFDTFKREALEWVEGTMLFVDVPGIAWSAIAEFNANKQGLTIYAHRIGLPSQF